MLTIGFVLAAVLGIIVKAYIIAGVAFVGAIECFINLDSKYGPFRFR